MALNAYYQYKTGQPINAGLTENDEKDEEDNDDDIFNSGEFIYSERRKKDYGYGPYYESRNWDEDYDW